MRQEKEHFTKVNQNLQLIVEDLKMRQQGLNMEIENQTVHLKEQSRYIKQFKDDAQELFVYLEKYKQLKSSIIRLHKKYVKGEFKLDSGEADAEKQYSDTRAHLEKSVDNERRVITKNADTYRKANNKMMKENVTLLKEINDLRKEVMKIISDAREKNARQGIQAGVDQLNDESISDQTRKELQLQDAKIDDLTNQLRQLQQYNEELMARASSRGGKRLAALPGTSIPLNEFDEGNQEMDAPEEEKRDEGYEESPQMEPRGTHQQQQEEQLDESPGEASPEFMEGGVVVADDLPAREQFDELREEQDSPGINQSPDHDENVSEH